MPWLYTDILGQLLSATLSGNLCPPVADAVLNAPPTHCVCCNFRVIRVFRGLIGNTNDPELQAGAFTNWSIQLLGGNWGQAVPRSHVSTI